jgi:CheY-like chemotaxis protein
MQTVLLVNDSRLEARILTDLLQSLGYEVRQSDEMVALDDMKRIMPDVVVVNYIMKTMRGDALIGMMKLLHPHALALLTSSSELSLASFRQRRVDGVLRTPATREQLQRALQRAQAHRESLHPTA